MDLHYFLDLISYRRLSEIKNILENYEIGDYDISIGVIEAARGGSLDILQLIMEYGYNIQHDAALNAAVLNEEYDTVNFLLKNGSNVNARSADGPGYPLITASKNGDLNMVMLLLNNGADVNVRNDYPLKYAIINNHPNIVRLLLESGAKFKKWKIFDKKFLKNIRAWKKDISLGMDGKFNREDENILRTSGVRFIDDEVEEIPNIFSQVHGRDYDDINWYISTFL